MFDANGGSGGTDNGVAEDTRLYGYDPMISPALIQEEIPAVLLELPRYLTQSSESLNTVLSARRGIQNILSEKDDRLLVMVGPCSIHDPAAAIEYAQRLKPLAEELNKDLLVVMRAYLEKPVFYP